MSWYYHLLAKLIKKYLNQDTLTQNTIEMIESYAAGMLSRYATSPTILLASLIYFDRVCKNTSPQWEDDVEETIITLFDDKLLTSLLLSFKYQEEADYEKFENSSDEFDDDVSAILTEQERIFLADINFNLWVNNDDIKAFLIEYGELKDIEEIITSCKREKDPHFLFEVNHLLREYFSSSLGLNINEKTIEQAGINPDSVIELLKKYIENYLRGFEEFYKKHPDLTYERAQIPLRLYFSESMSAEIEKQLIMNYYDLSTLASRIRSLIHAGEKDSTIAKILNDSLHPFTLTKNAEAIVKEGILTTDEEALYNSLPFCSPFPFERLPHPCDMNYVMKSIKQHFDYILHAIGSRLNYSYDHLLDELIDMLNHLYLDLPKLQSEFRNQLVISTFLELKTRQQLPLTAAMYHSLMKVNDVTQLVTLLNFFKKEYSMSGCSSQTPLIDQLTAVGSPLFKNPNSWPLIISQIQTKALDMLKTEKDIDFESYEQLFMEPSHDWIQTEYQELVETKFGQPSKKTRLN